MCVVAKCVGCAGWIHPSWQQTSMFRDAVSVTEAAPSVPLPDLLPCCCLFSWRACESCARVSLFAAGVLTLYLHKSYLYYTEEGGARRKWRDYLLWFKVRILLCFPRPPASPFPLLTKINSRQKDKQFWLAFKMLSIFNESVTSNHPLHTNWRQGCRTHANVLGTFARDCPSMNFLVVNLQCQSILGGFRSLSWQNHPP